MENDSSYPTMNSLIKCRCGVEFDLRAAPWCSCGQSHTYETKLCPNGHCVCHLLDDLERWRDATKQENQYGFIIMLKEEYGGVHPSPTREIKE